ncbi:hypothetical protein NQ314_010569, partial [Rhamnusium bicolor]
MRVFSRCAARKCTNNSNNCSVSFFRFPRDVNRARIWLVASGRDDLSSDVEKIHASSYRLCSMHFEKSMFANEKRNRLRKEVIPRQFPALERSSSATAEFRSETGNWE